jgi:hypothetical protein
VRKIPLSASLLTFLDDLEFTEAALSAHPETADFALPFREEIEAWEPIFKKEREGRRNVTRAEALVAVRNTQLDATTTRFGASALGEAGGDRKNASFRKFFPIAPSQFIRKPLRKQCEHTLNAMIPELDKLDKNHPLAAYSAPLAALAKDALKALDARSKAKAQRSLATSDVDEWKEGVNALRLTAHAELLKIAAENGFNRAWADAFFQSDPTAAGDDADPPPKGSPETGDKAESP